MVVDELLKQTIRKAELLTKSVTGDEDGEPNDRGDSAHVEFFRDVGDPSSVKGRSDVNSECQKTRLEHDPCLPRTRPVLWVLQVTKERKQGLPAHTSTTRSQQRLTSGSVGPSHSTKNASFPFSGSPFRTAVASEQIEAVSATDMSLSVDWVECLNAAAIPARASLAKSTVTSSRPDEGTLAIQMKRVRCTQTKYRERSMPSRRLGIWDIWRGLCWNWTCQ